MISAQEFQRHPNRQKRRVVMHEGKKRQRRMNAMLHALQGLRPQKAAKLSNSPSH